MNKKIILTLLLTVFFGVISIYFKAEMGQEKPSSDFRKVVLSFLIKGCAETGKEMTTKSVGKETEQEPKIESGANWILYSRAINHLCGRKATVEKEIKGSSINIYEVWSGIGAKCICFSKIEARLENVSFEKYEVNVYEKGTQPGNGSVPMEEKLIISRKISVP